MYRFDTLLVCFDLQDAILSTMDIIYEGFGFMLSFGDLAWVPFLYCLQGRFLLEHDIPLPWYCLAALVFLNCKFLYDLCLVDLIILMNISGFFFHSLH